MQIHHYAAVGSSVSGMDHLAHADDLVQLLKHVTKAYETVTIVFNKKNRARSTNANYLFTYTCINIIIQYIIMYSIYIRIYMSIIY